jgi:murein DD-endopeptidase MepM/ murein hydrolase activator NlpD
MVIARFRTLQRAIETLFPERHLYIRSGGEMRGVVLTTGKQLAGAGMLAGAALWMGICTAAMMVSAMSVTSVDQEAAATTAKYERWIADRQARLSSAVAQLNASNGSVDELAASVEKRHAALAMLMGDMHDMPGAAQALEPARPRLASNESAVDRVRDVRVDQDRLLDVAESFTRSRAERLRTAIRLAGLSPEGVIANGDGGLGGPLIEAKDPRALAAILDVDENFAQRIHLAATDLSDLHSLDAAAERLPIAHPTTVAAESSSYGVREDPFTGRPAFHAGLDFPGPYSTPIYSTAPGIVSFTGVRAGYGNTIEIDHGGGFKTRYAHLSAIGVAVGQRVAVAQRIGAMGSTGRSTGTHLHYEVWAQGRPQNPNRFLKAGDYVQQTN